MGRAVATSLRAKNELKVWRVRRERHEADGTHGVLGKVLDEQFLEGKVVSLDKRLNVGKDTGTCLVVHGTLYTC